MFVLLCPIVTLCNIEFPGHFVNETYKQGINKCFDEVSCSSTVYEECMILCPERCDTMKLSFIYSFNQINKENLNIYIIYDDTKYIDISDVPKLTSDELVASIGFVKAFFYLIISIKKENF